MAEILKGNCNHSGKLGPPETESDFQLLQITLTTLMSILIYALQGPDNLSF